jgi:hypothetical protein
MLCTTGSFGGCKLAIGINELLEIANRTWASGASCCCDLVAVMRRVESMGAEAGAKRTLSWS